ncbi:MAG: DUF2306 domain-containing protein [Polyangiales bacterium]
MTDARARSTACTRRLRVAAAWVALVFLVLPSLSRLSFLLRAPPAADATDAAFLAHRPTGLTHVVAGLLLLALTPLQLSATARRRWPWLHRWSGRVFVLVGLAVSMSAGVMNAVFPVIGGLATRSVIAAMIVAQVTTLSLGLRAISRRDVAQHRRWMTRAAGVALSAGSAGLFAAPLFAAGVDRDVTVGAARWIGFVTTLAVVEGWLRGHVVAGDAAPAPSQTPLLSRPGGPLRDGGDRALRAARGGDR